MKFLRYAVLAATTVLLAACSSGPPAPTVERTPVGIEKPLRPVAGAAGAPAAGYVVKKGDTLYSIARAHGVDPKDLASWNGIENSNQIALGQQLQVTPPRAETALPSAVAGGAVVQPIAQPAAVEVKPIASRPLPEVSTALLKREPKGGKVPYSEEALAKAKGTALAPVADAPAAVVAPAVVAAAVPVVPGAIEWIWPHNGKLLATFVEGSSKGLDIAGNPGDPVLASAPGKIVYAGVGLRGYGKLVIVRHNAEFLSAYAHNSAILVKEGDTVARRQKIAEVGSTDADSPRLHFEIRRQGKPTDPLKFLPSR
jgi:lipoprotein NlpD